MCAAGWVEAIERTLSLWYCPAAMSDDSTEVPISARFRPQARECEGERSEAPANGEGAVFSTGAARRIETRTDD